MPNKIQSLEHSRGGGMGDILRISVWRNPNGKRNIPYLNWNGNERYLNLNWFENDWNENYRFVALRKSFLFSPPNFGGFILEILATHLTSYRPRLFSQISGYIVCYQEILSPTQLGERI